MDHSHNLCELFSDLKGATTSNWKLKLIKYLHIVVHLNMNFNLHKMMALNNFSTSVLQNLTNGLFLQTWVQTKLHCVYWKVSILKMERNQIFMKQTLLAPDFFFCVWCLGRWDHTVMEPISHQTNLSICQQWMNFLLQQKTQLFSVF